MKRIGLVGCGDWGKQILKCLTELGCEVTVVARSEQSQENARAFGATTIISSTTDLEGVDGIVIATATETHFDLIQELLVYDIPIFVEKPVTASLEQTAVLKSTANGKVFVMDKYRYHPAIRVLAQLVDNRTYGKLMSLKTTRNGWRVPKGPVNFIWDLAPHELSIVLTICGHIPELRYKTIEQLDETPVACIAIFGNEPSVICEMNKGSSSKFREVRVNFADALAIWNTDEEDKIRILTLAELSEKSSPGKILQIAKENPLTLELLAFLAFLDGGIEPQSNLTDALLIAQRISALA